MASRRSKRPAKKRPRRKPTLPVTFDLADDVKIKITKKYGHIYLRFLQAGKLTQTIVTNESGLISLGLSIYGVAEEIDDIKLMQSCQDALALLIPYSKYRSAKRCVSDLIKAFRFSCFVMKRVREANFKEGARAQAIREAMTHFQIVDVRTAEKLLARHKRVNPGFHAKMASDDEWQRYLGDDAYAEAKQNTL
jgi:hypothetical protein